MIKVGFGSKSMIKYDQVGLPYAKSQPRLDLWTFTKS